ncbi:MAG: polysaccharide biosynthesis/export family protein [Bryobacterales bacterium]|nr:polysaccharide biosynthesis/export family protein [Bryobacterales bacterium]
MPGIVKSAILLYAVAMHGTGFAGQPTGRQAYVLGPGDEIVIRALDVPEISDRSVRIDMQGLINLPMVGRVQAGGLSVEELEAELTRRLRTYVIEPQVTVSITQFRSQPVSVLGAVGNPGVLQLEGRRSLFEVLSLAGGLRPDAGDTIRITRRREWGRIPLPGAYEDASGQFWVAEVPVKAVMEAQNPEQNILVCPFDVITVPRAQMVYVIGSVRKPGGFVLGDREILTALQALSLAEGLDRGAAPQNAKILRASQGSPTRTEIPIDLKRILQGKASDVPLGPEDILFVPGSTSKNLAYRSLEAMFAIGTGFAIYRGANR